MPDSTVFEAWSKVMDEVQSISKDSRNRTQNFNFRGIDAVMNAVGPSLRRHGVSVVPSALEESSERYETSPKEGHSRGTQMVNRVVKVAFTVYGPNGDSFTGSAYGEAADSGDKAVSKAHSVAYRTFLLQALTIPTDEVDPDSHSHERSAPERSRPMALGDQALIASLLEAVDRSATRDKAAKWFREKYNKDVKYGTDEELNEAILHFTELAVQKELL